MVLSRSGLAFARPIRAHSHTDLPVPDSVTSIDRKRGDATVAIVGN